MNAISIYKSSAGSGKTYTLVREYLKLVLPYPAGFRHILAITFTNKATEEMKSRILSALIQLSKGENKLLAAELSKDPAFSELNLKTQAQQCVDFILHHYADFAVTTIDSFFNSIVKSLAHEMKLPLRFEIELDQEFINEEICRRLLDEIGKDEKLTTWLHSFALDKMEDERGWKIDDELRKIGRQIFKEDFYTRQTAGGFDYDGFVQHLKETRKIFEETARSYGNRFREQLINHKYTIDDFSYKKSGVAGYLSKIAGTDLIATDYLVKSYTSKAHDNIDAWLTKENRTKPIAQLVSSALHPLLREYISFYKTKFAGYCTACEALKLIYVAGIVSQLAKHFRNYRDEHELITIADANLLIKNFVSSNDTPFVYEKTGNKYRHFLLDEFQDTSDVQWRNLLPLITNALASGNSALIVGDVKQAIYRWRSGNMNLLQNGIKDDLKTFSSIFKEQKLNINYRSTSEVVQFNNTFFESLPLITQRLEIADHEMVDAAYKAEEVIQLLPEKNKLNGFVKIHFINEKELEEIHQEKRGWKQESLEQLIPLIDQLRSDGYSFGDIAILVRSGGEGNEIARYLFNNGIDKIISPDSLLIYKAPQVQFIINLLRYLHDDKNILVKKELLYFMLRMHKQDGDLHRPFSEEDELSNSLFDHYIKQKLAAQGSAMFEFPVHEVTERLIKSFELARVADAYLLRLLDVMLEYSEKNAEDSGSFVRWWDEHSARKNYSVITPAKGDAITISTIHKSKGLQYPVVLMPYSDWDLKPKANEVLWVSSEEEPYHSIGEIPVNFSAALEHTYFSDHHHLELNQTYLDNINLLYVAFTRAEERLYITAPYSESDKVTCVSRLMMRVIQSTEEWRNTFDSSEQLLVIGSEVARSTKAATEPVADYFHPEATMLNALPLTDWRQQLEIKTKKDYTSREMERGNVLHKALSLMITESDLEAALNKCSNLFNLAEESMMQLRLQAEKILNVARGHGWFSGKYRVRNEAELWFGSELLRPDRLMMDDNEAIIIDYKTGLESNAYHHQVRKYGAALRKMGVERVSTYLLYTAEGRIQRVEEATV